MAQDFDIGKHRTCLGVVAATYAKKGPHGALLILNYIFPQNSIANAMAGEHSATGGCFQ